jgi:hypothetical protein
MNTFKKNNSLLIGSKKEQPDFPPETPSFDYVYYIMALTYVSEVKNDIYGLHYDLLGSESVVTESVQSYTYESLEKTYSWF